LAPLLASGERQALLARVRDRFGDYGEVGLCVYSPCDHDLVVEDFLLSCRVLGKGVEHQMLAALGRIAGELGKEHVVVPFRRTERNEPAARFLEAVGGAFRHGDLYRFPAARASAVAFDPGQVREPFPPAFQESRTGGDIASVGCDFAEIAKLASVQEIQLAIRLKRLHGRPVLATEFVPPSYPAEQTLAEIWADALRLERVGIHDDFFALGGDSILTVQILSKANRAGLRLTLRQHFQFPTISQLASMAGPGKAESDEAMSVASGTPSPRYSLAKLGPKTLDQVMAHLAKTKR
jgi:aryl carrier-like protein